MKTQVIHLEAGEDLASVVDKIQFTRSGRILLVWPSGGLNLGREIDLILLYRHTLELGSQLALVVRDPKIKRIARGLGIPTFRSAVLAMRDEWASSLLLSISRNPSKKMVADLRQQQISFKPKTSRWTNSKWVRFPVFSLSIFSVIILIVLFIPSAQIKASIAPGHQEVQIAVQASPSESTVRLSGIVPVHTRSIIIDGTLSRLASGKASIPENYAIGDVRFTNLTDEEIVIPKDAIVSTLGFGPIKYHVVMEGTLPAGSGNTIDLTVRAKQAGASGNKLSGSIQLIEGDLSGKVVVSNPDPIQGGTDRFEPAPTDADREVLKSTILQNLQQQAQQKVINGLSSENQMIMPNIRLSKILDEKYTPADNSPSENISLSMQGEFVVEYVNTSDLLTLAAGVLDTRLESDATPLQETLHQKTMTQPTLDPDGNYSWEISAQREYLIKINDQNIVRNSTGLLVEDAQSRIKNQLGNGSLAIIRTFPSWWPWMPIYPFRISLEAGTNANSGS